MVGAQPAELRVLPLIVAGAAIVGAYLLAFGLDWPWHPKKPKCQLQAVYYRAPRPPKRNPAGPWLAAVFYSVMGVNITAAIGGWYPPATPYVLGALELFVVAVVIVVPSIIVYRLWRLCQLYRSPYWRKLRLRQLRREPPLPAGGPWPRTPDACVD